MDVTRNVSTEGLRHEEIKKNCQIQEQKQQSISKIAGYLDEIDWARNSWTNILQVK